MSGIAGIFHCGTAKPVDPVRVERMCDALAHRGPDGAGVWTAPGIGLGVRHLAISDRCGPPQPLQSLDERALLVLDGEIYNGSELRRELKELGTQFRTDDDAEVILAAWQRWDTACLPRLHGEFALAIYDVAARTLLLGRDRLGVKPLFMAHLSDGSLAFASELKGLLAHPLLRREVDPLAIEDYLAWGFVPDHRSILKGVGKLPAGHSRLLRHGAAPDEPRRWWDVTFAERHRGREHDLEAELLHHLREAVINRMGADVPPGALLAGRVDSSTVIALMAEASRAPITTCGIDFEGPRDDDTVGAARVAALFGADHATRPLGGYQLGVIDALVAMFDEPFADASALPAWRLCQLARERMTVALSGDGADEVFAGHRRLMVYRHLERMRQLVPAGVRRGVLETLRRRYPKAGALALTSSGAEGYARNLSAVSPEPRNAIYTTEFSRELGEYRAEQRLISLMHSAPARSGLDRAQYAELRFRLPGAVLTKVDRTSMAVSLAVREPLLDHRLVEFASRLPERMRVRGGRGAWLLRRAMRRYLPDDTLDPRTQQPALPVAEWLRGPLAGETLAIAASAALARTGWFDTGYLLRLAEAHRSGRGDHSRVLWPLLVLDRSLVGLGVIS